MSTAAIHKPYLQGKTALLHTRNGGTVRANVARLLLQKLAENCEAYCILTGYENLPDSFETDIDFMVTPVDFKQMPALIEEIAVESDTRLFQVIPHEVSARAFLLVAESERGITLLQLDSCSDYRHFGKLWLRSEEILGAKKWNPRGFWTPESRYEFIYYLLKRVSKRDFKDIHGSRLSRLYREDPSGCDTLLRRFWGGYSAAALAEMAADENWTVLKRDVAPYRIEARHHNTEGFASKAVSCYARARHACERITQPTGAWIAFIGPDGCGKSSIIDALTTDLAPAFQKTLKCHLRPKSLPARSIGNVPVTDPHGQPVRGSIASIMKLFYLFADYWIGYLKRVRSATVRTGLVVFDRYFYDVVIDPHRVRYGGPRWLVRLVAKCIPKPDLILLLDAPPDVLWSRKRELRYDEVVRQQQTFMRMARAMERAVIIDSAQPIPEVLQRARLAVIDYFSQRTRRRLGLFSESPTTLGPLSGGRVSNRANGIDSRIKPERIVSGKTGAIMPERLQMRIIAKDGAPKWLLPEDPRAAGNLLKSWRPYGRLSHLKWRVVTTACRLGAVASMPGVVPRTLDCDLSYWREHIPGYSESWSLAAYIGGLSPTRKAVLFFISPHSEVQCVVKVPIEAAAQRAVLNEADTLSALQGVIPAPRVLFRDDSCGIAAQSWIGGVNVSRAFRKQHLELLTSFASSDMRVRLSDYRDETANRIEQVRAPIDPSLLRTALLQLDQSDEVTACIEHGDFIPWNLRRLPDGRLALIDWEWAREIGMPWQDVCRYFYMQDYLFRESANVWKALVENPLLGEYRRFYKLSTELTAGLTIYYLLDFICKEQGDQSRVEYAVQQIRKIIGQTHR